MSAWEQELQLLTYVFRDKNNPYADGSSLVGDIIRLNWNQNVSRNELKDEQALVKLLYLETVKLNNQSDSLDGILSGGYNKN
jgi:hypothetical protein